MVHSRSQDGWKDDEEAFEVLIKLLLQAFVFVRLNHIFKNHIERRFLPTFNSPVARCTDIPNHNND